ncbi:hypothetical protein AJ79_05360 [Helicocarpus griseus UAMH5409]|uniref:Uncharacterized protein n=1 Tax=Helicocarpus griseus UAMH5409 TaxID=1447875 RepID=A0A2B7XNA8_9EURO|nr:hypothetical protein AJ79_05360 [Helicocarpus griseus UAMH5409]
MTRILLFCTAEEAKPFIPKILKTRSIFYLVESTTCPATRDGFKTSLADNDTSFQSDFLNASAQQCKDWALEKQAQVKFIEMNIIAIADARTAVDQTISMCYYNEAADEGPLDFDEWGPLPPEGNKWYDYRIDYRGAVMVHVALMYGPFDSAYPTYFGRKAELTDANGVFDVERANRYVRGEEGGETTTGEN